MSIFDKWLGDLAGTPSPTYSIDLPEREGIVRLRMTFFGRVQGVGFRYTVKMAADQLGLTGWVHNNVDGSVAAELQGKIAAIRLLSYQIQEGHYIRIDDVRVEEMAADPRESNFSIR